VAPGLARHGDEGRPVAAAELRRDQGVVELVDAHGDVETIERMVGRARSHLGVDVRFVAAGASLPWGAIDPLVVPLRAVDDAPVGVLWCASRPKGGSADEVAIRLLAELATDELARRRREAQGWRAKIRSTALNALLAALDARDGYTKDHSEAVVELSAAAASRLGLRPDQVDHIRQVALLHDLGKIAIPESILAKPGALAAGEWEQMRRHSAIGARIVASIGDLEHLAPAIRAGHERWDGRGYPDGLAGDDIPLASRVVFLCDAYHAMVSHRPYRRALAHGLALAELERSAGSQFCPLAARALLEGI
jgi:HD-GYP domain-containing protein (c-di-GMP phosphodiesterase class II)